MRTRTAIFAVLLLAVLAAPASAAVRPLETGVSYVYDEDEPTATFAQVKAAGARLAHTPVRWGSVAPEVPPPGFQPGNPADPSYEWEDTDRWVSHAVAAGLTPVLQIRGAPRWAQRCVHVFSTDTPCNPDPAQLAAFATAAAIRYSGNFGGLPRVRHWQGLNEPNLSLFFLPQFEGNRAVSPILYRTLINSFSAAIKSVHPSNLAILAGLGPIEVPKHTLGPLRFARELLCMRGRERFRPARGNCGGGVAFDIFAIHPYTTGGPTHEGGRNDVQLGGLGRLHALLRAADRAGRIKNGFRHTPLWVTEFSWDTSPPDPGGLPMKIATRWTAEALHTAWRAGIGTFFWFSIRDEEADPGTPAHASVESGLYFRGPTVAQEHPKDIMRAFRFPFVAYPRRGGLVVWGRTPISRGGRVVVQGWRGRGWRKLGTVRADRAGIFRDRLNSGYGRGRSGRVRAVYKGRGSVPFSMRPVGDFRQPPFGRPVG